MANLPSITTTYMRAFTLYLKSYMPVLPFTLVAVILAFFINKMLPIPVGTFQLNWSQYANLVLQLLISLLFFSLILYGCYQKHNNLKFDYLDIFNTVIKRFFFVVLSFVLMMLPLFACLFLNHIMFGLTSPHVAGSQGSMVGIYFLLLSIATIVVAIATLIFACYFYVSTFEIVIKGKAAVAGLIGSWKLIRGHWFKTFLILVIFLVPLMILSFYLTKVLGNIAGPLINLVLYPFGTSLMVIYHEHLEKDSQAMVTTPDKN